MLAIANKHGEIQASIPGLARVAAVSVEDCERAINRFMSPDKYSRTPDDEGRRIEKIEGGWVLINHSKYRAMASKDEEKTASAIRQQRFRDQKKRNSSVTKSNGEVTPSNDAVTEDRDIADTDTDTKAKKNTPLTPQGGVGEQSELIPSANPDFMPIGWKRLTERQRKLVKVKFNTPKMIQVGSWFRRKESNLWNVSEAASITEIDPTTNEVNGMGRYYLADIEPDKDIRRRDLQTLLNNWGSELDRARAFCGKMGS